MPDPADTITRYVEEARGRAEAATEGSWECRFGKHDKVLGLYTEEGDIVAAPTHTDGPNPDANVVTYPRPNDWLMISDEDIAFILAARADVPTLAAVVGVLVEGLTDVLLWAKDHPHVGKVVIALARAAALVESGG